MSIEIGRVEAIFRYPIKSMRGEPLRTATLGWHGIDGDRRVAVRRVTDRSAFPWLSASSLPDLMLFTPRPCGDGGGDSLPTHVLTPDGAELPLFGEALAAEIGRRFGSAVELMQSKNGVFDDACISVITTRTVLEVCRLANRNADMRRFRPNIVVRSVRAVPFEEDGWLGGTLTFGEGAGAAAVAVTVPDTRCAMVNIDPDDGSIAPELLKAAVRANQNNAGVYGTVTRIGHIAVGQTVVLRR